MEHMLDTDLNLTGFLDEARGYAPQVTAGLDALAANLDDRAALEEIFRLAHTIRGSSGTAGLEEVSTIAQSAEELAEAILNGDLPMDAESVDLFREAFNGAFDAVERAAPTADGAKPQPKKKSTRPQMQETVRREDVPPELVEGFLIEAGENLALVESSLREYEEDRGKKHLLKDARRGVHTIKGAGGMVGLWGMAKLAKRVEDLLDEVYDGDREWSRDLSDLVDASRGALSDLVSANGDPEPHQDLLDALHAAYDQLNPAEETESADVESATPVAAPAAAVAIAADSPMGEGFLEGFLEEAAALLEGLDGLIANVPSSKETVQEVRRRVHTIKGSAGMVGLRGLSQLAHRMEDMLDRLYEGTVEHSAPLQTLLVATSDTIADIIGDGGRATAHADRLQDLYRRYSDIGNASAVTEVALVPVRQSIAEPPPQPQQQPPADAGAQHVRVPIDKLDEMVRLVGELFAVRSSFDRSLAGYRHEIGELELTLRRLRRIATQFENEYAVYSPGVTDGPVAAPRAAHGADRSEFDALEFDRYTQFHLLSRDLMESVSDIATAEHLLTTLAGDFDLSLNRQGRLTSEIQDRLMHLRMVPLSTLAPRLQRTVRVTAERTGKQVNLSLEGFAVEIDKTAMEQLAGPLEHLLRNAVDHGIESSAARLAAGKQEAGSIHIEAEYEGTQIVIRLSDDGGGLDAARIAEIAVKRGLISLDQAISLDQESLLPLIFEPGFTTAGTITEISGRGVGLDIVKSVVEGLKGSVSAATETGHWTSFTLRLPMSLSITKVLMVEANQETFALPLGSVVQVARVDYGQIETIAGKRVVRHERRLIPAVWLGEVLALPKAPVPGAKQSLVVVQAGGDRHALMVDRIVEARQVMVNPPSGILRRAPAVAGATVMGDGSVVLVLNPVETVMPQRVAAMPPRRPVQPKFVELPAVFDVLVVDDSLSVRRVVSNLIQKSGWNPIQAKDGVEALEVLRHLERHPDVILLDVEMPRMDGYEFAAAIRGSNAFKNIPIIMLTSRAGDKHRKKAMDAGVNGYLVKPYQDDNLVAMVKEWVARGRGEI